MTAASDQLRRQSRKQTDAARKQAMREQRERKKAGG